MKLKHLLFRSPDDGAGGAPAPVIDPAAPPAGGTPPPAAPPATPTGWVKDDGSFEPGWLDRLPPDLVNLKPTAAKYNSLPAFLKAHGELNSRLGKHATAVYVPGDDATPEELAAYRTRLGVPETPDLYDFKPELPEGVQWNDDDAKAYAAIAHKHNIPPAAMKDLAALQIQQEQSRGQAGYQEYVKEIEQGHATLRQEWGQGYEKQLSQAERMAASVGYKLEKPGLQDPVLVKAFARMADLVSEDKLIAGGHAPTQMVGKTMGEDIMNNPSNPKHALWKAGDKATLSYVNDLFKQSA